MDAQTVIAAGVALNLLGALIRHFVHNPRRQAQIDAIEAKLNSVVAQLGQKGGGV